MTRYDGGYRGIVLPTSLALPRGSASTNESPGALLTGWLQNSLSLPVEMVCPSTTAREDSQRQARSPRLRSRCRVLMNLPRLALARAPPIRAAAPGESLPADDDFLASSSCFQLCGKGFRMPFPVSTKTDVHGRWIGRGSVFAHQLRL